MCDAEDLPAGARLVGSLADATPACRLAVWATRSWLDGPVGQQAVWNHFAIRLGARDAHLAAQRLEAHLSTVARHACRILHRRRVDCRCLGADEAVLGRLVECAALGHCAGVCAAAMLIVRGDGVVATVESAHGFGRSALRIGDAPRATFEAASEFDDAAAPVASSAHGLGPHRLH